MIDLNAIKHRHLDPERMKGRTYYAGHLELDLAALVAEVERLREQRVASTAALLKGYETGKAEERAAVVAWLHRMERNARHWGGKDDERADIYARLADVFECGEHRSEEET